MSGARSRSGAAHFLTSSIGGTGDERERKLIRPPEKDTTDPTEKPPHPAAHGRCPLPLARELKFDDIVRETRRNLMREGNSADE